MSRSILPILASGMVAAAAIGLLTPTAEAGAPVSPAALSADGTIHGADFEREAQKLLEALRVNATTASPKPDAPAALMQGLSETVNVTVGGSKTLTLPGAFEKAIVVLPDVADVVVLRPGQAQVIARQAGTTDIVFSDAAGAVYKAKVIVGLDATPVQQALAQALPGEPIAASSMHGAIYLSGTTRDASVAATAVAIARRFAQGAENGVINQIQVLGGQQVMLQVRVAEVRRSVMKDLGLNTALDFQSRSGAVIGNAPGLAQYGQGSGPAQAIQAMANSASPVGFISQKMLGGVLTSVIDALESEGLVRTLAEPNLVAISGKTANMLAGGQYPVPAVSDDGSLGTEYRNFGVSLGFTPTVLSPTSIGLEIETEVSARGENVPFPTGPSTTVSIPVFNTRRASTSVELPSGGSLVIAGLLQSEFQNLMQGLPGAKDIPIIGKLVSSTQFQRNETELVITVTAFLVEPIDAAKASLPTDGLLPPSDADLYLLNRLTGMSGRTLQAPPPGLDRHFGYITE